MWFIRAEHEGRRAEELPFAEIIETLKDHGLQQYVIERNEARSSQKRKTENVDITAHPHQQQNMAPATIVQAEQIFTLDVLGQGRKRKSSCEQDTQSGPSKGGKNGEGVDCTRKYQNISSRPKTMSTERSIRRVSQTTTGGQPKPFTNNMPTNAANSSTSWKKKFICVTDFLHGQEPVNYRPCNQSICNRRHIPKPFPGRFSASDKADLLLSISRMNYYSEVQRAAMSAVVNAIV